MTAIDSKSGRVTWDPKDNGGKEYSLGTFGNVRVVQSTTITVPLSCEFRCARITGPIEEIKSSVPFDVFVATAFDRSGRMVTTWEFVGHCDGSVSMMSGAVPSDLVEAFAWPEGNCNFSEWTKDCLNFSRIAEVKLVFKDVPGATVSLSWTNRNFIIPEGYLQYSV